MKVVDGAEMKRREREEGGRKEEEEKKKNKGNESGMWREGEMGRLRWEWMHTKKGRKEGGSWRK